MKIKAKYLIISIVMLCVFTNSKNIFATIYYFKDNVTTQHTKEEIVEKYNETINKNYPDSEYEIMPDSSYPYVVGSLKQEAVNSTIDRINYFRWLYGINGITENLSKMERNQKGAILLENTGVLTHTPQKPEEMAQEFFDEASIACSYGSTPGDIFSGNVAYDNFHSFPDLVDLYIADINNGDTSNGAVGHRLSILDPFATKTSFGKCGNFSTLSIYYEDDAEAYNNVSNNKLDTQAFYSYPSAGYFPREFFYTNEYWSVLIPQGYYVSSKINVVIEYEGQKYIVPYIQEKSYYAIDFKLPDVLIEKIGGNDVNMPEGNFKVTISGIKIPGNASMNIEYSVNFFDADIQITSILTEKDEYNVKVGEKEKIKLFYSPAAVNVDSEKVEWNVEDPNIASIDSNGIITAKNPGNTTISIKALGLTQKCNLTVEGEIKYQKGDLDRNGIIDANDATKAIELFSTEKYSQEDLEIGDLDNNNIIDSNDASLIIQMYKTSN